MRYLPLKHSARQVLPGTLYARALPAGETVSVSVYLRSRRPHDFAALVRDLYTQPLRRRPRLEVAELADIYGASAEDRSLVEEFAAQNGLRAESHVLGGRGVRLTGPLPAIETAFRVQLREYGGRSEQYRGRTGSIHLPEHLVDAVDAVVGLDDRPVGRAYFRYPARETPPWKIPQLADVYDFPAELDGTGQAIAVLAFNGREGRRERQLEGGYYPEALDDYFRTVLGDRPLEPIHEAVVHGPGNVPGAGEDLVRDTTTEIMMDIQILRALAPGAGIKVYFTEFTEVGWLDALEHIIFDTEYDPSVLSISYGNPEDAAAVWTDMALYEIDRAFRAAALRGITVCAASGDNGSQDSPMSTRVYADFPAASPHVLACGGTTLETDVAAEVAWNDEQGATGGGVSRVFALPEWQAVVGVPPAANADRTVGRGIPDTAAIADPGVEFVVRSADDVRAGTGTSIAAPLWAALVARLNQGLGLRVGLIGPWLYSLPRSALSDIIHGHNGTYAAGPGWDACTGLGTPRGRAILDALRSAAQGESIGGEMPDDPTMIVHRGRVTHMIVHGRPGGSPIGSASPDSADTATHTYVITQPSPWRTRAEAVGRSVAGAVATAALVQAAPKVWPKIRVWIIKGLGGRP